MRRTSCSQKGSSLIGVALMTLALGFLITGGIYLLQNYNIIHSDHAGIDNTRKIETALLDFVAQNKRYPCPAPMTAAPDTPNFGKESLNCAGTWAVSGRAGKTVHIGAVPVRTLNISDSQIVDGYKKRYFYAITQELTESTTDARHDTGAITLENENGDSISSTPGHIVYLIMSPGQDDRGAYDTQGTLLQPCGTSSSESASENCDFITGTGDATFVTTTQTQFDTDSAAFTHKFAFSANTTPYKWHTDPWTSCNGICFEGTQTRSVECRDHKGDPAPSAANCNHTEEPDSGPRNCVLPPCTWEETWGSCNGGPSPSGTSSNSLSCDTDGDGDCAGDDINPRDAGQFDPRSGNHGAGARK